MEGLNEKESHALVKAYRHELSMIEEGTDQGVIDLGWTWKEAGIPSHIANSLTFKDLVHVPYQSSKRTQYKLTDAGRELAQSLSEQEDALGDAVQEVEPQLTETELADLFNDIVGYEDEKQLIRASMSLDKPVHILLAGPPSIAKSMFLWDIEKAGGDAALWVMGTGTSKMGVWDMVVSKRPKWLLVDELEKMAPADMVGLLGLMEKGRIVRAKVGRNIDAKLNIWVFATANRIDNLPAELKSRFSIRMLRHYTHSEFVEVVRNVLVHREGVDQATADLIALRLVGRTNDVRDAIRVARIASAVGAERAIELLMRESLSRG